MKRLLLTTAFLAATTIPGAAALLTVEVLDDATVVANQTSATGAVNIFTSDVNFSTISVTATGVPQIANPDLSSVSLNVQSATGGHTITVDIFQTGVSAAAGAKLSSTGTTNDLVGAPGPTIETTFFNGTDSTLGTQLATHTFPAGDVSDHFGPIITTLPAALIADAQQYQISFSAAGQSSNDTMQLKTAIPEPSTWALMSIGFGFIVFVGWCRAKGPRTLEGLTSG